MRICSKLSFLTKASLHLCTENYRKRNLLLEMQLVGECPNPPKTVLQRSTATERQRSTTSYQIHFAQILPTIEATINCKVLMNMKTYKLELTPLDQAAHEAEQEEKKTAYRRDYWQQYKKQHKRIYGIVSKAEFNELKALAHANGHTLWQEILSQSKAYRSNEYLPSEDVKLEIEKLYLEIRTINDNINRAGNQNKLLGRLVATNKISEQLKVLEQKIEDFTSNPWNKS